MDTRVTRRKNPVRRAVVLTLTIMLALGSLAVTPMDTIAGAEDGVATVDELNLRAEPALNATILDVMPAGAAVELTGDPVAGFYPVAYGGQTGWAYSAYLTTGFTGDGVVTTGGQQGEVFVADGPVNFRTGPSTADEIISVIPDGALVALNGDSANGFLSIIYTDQSGWAHADSVLGTGEANPAPVDVPAAPEAPARQSTPVKAHINEYQRQQHAADDQLHRQATASSCPRRRDRFTLRRFACGRGNPHHIRHFGW